MDILIGTALKTEQRDKEREERWGEQKRERNNEKLNLTIEGWCSVKMR